MIHIDTQSTTNDESREAVYRWLREFNGQANPGFIAAIERGASKPIAVLARTDDHSLVGGLFGDTLLSWLRIQIVAVSPEARRSGIGRQLVLESEREARMRGCDFAYVDTMSYQSPEFYIRLGYSEVGRIPNWDSHGHSKHFLTRRLS